MEFRVAMSIIKNQGFFVRFEYMEDSRIVEDIFPDVLRGDDPLRTEEYAWDAAEKFAAKMRGRCFNVYVVDSDHNRLGSGRIFNERSRAM